jgi:arylsulfatase A-like enzyme
MMPLLRGGQAEWPDEVFVQISESCVGRAIRTRRWKYAVRAPGKNGYEHMGSDVYQEEFLYDLQADPYELNNLAGIKTYDEVSAVLRERLLARMKSAGEEPPRIEPAPVRDPEQMLQPYWWRGASAEDAKG